MTKCKEYSPEYQILRNRLKLLRTQLIVQAKFLTKDEQQRINEEINKTKIDIAKYKYNLLTGDCLEGERKK